MNTSLPPFVFSCGASVRLRLSRMPRPRNRSRRFIEQHSVKRARPLLKSRLRRLSESWRAAASRCSTCGRPEEFAIAHIPGSINLYEKEVELVRQRYPDKATRLVFYCNGPFCGKSKRLSEQLVALGYTNVRRYQLGLPVWRALGHTVQTDLGGFRYIYKGTRRPSMLTRVEPLRRAKGTVPGAVFIQPGEAEKANEDGRLPYKDKGTRVIVFADTADAARKVAEEIAGKAYWNSSYFGGTFADLMAAKLW